MNITSVCVGLIFAALAYLGFYLFQRRTVDPRGPAIGAQRMCPHCGRITARSRAACLECGKALAPRAS
jgi:hypothetical protein